MKFKHLTIEEREKIQSMMWEKRSLCRPNGYMTSARYETDAIVLCWIGIQHYRLSHSDFACGTFLFTHYL